MSNSVYPTLPGLTYNVVRTPEFKTDMLTTPSGRSFSFSRMAWPLYRYTLSYEVLRDTSGYPEFRTLLGFYNAMRGSFDTFLLNDPDDNSVTAQQFGVGDGSTKTFQLVRTLGGNVEPVYDTNGAPLIYVAGTLKTAGTDYTINSTGGVTFVAAPAAAASVTWTGGYYWRVRFLNDTMDFNKFMNLLWEAKKVELVSVRP